MDDPQPEDHQKSPIFVILSEAKELPLLGHNGKDILRPYIGSERHQPDFPSTLAIALTLCPRMCPLILAFQNCRCDVGVDLRRADRGMPQQF